MELREDEARSVPKRQAWVEDSRKAPEPAKPSNSMEEEEQQQGRSQGWSRQDHCFITSCSYRSVQGATTEEDMVRALSCLQSHFQKHLRKASSRSHCYRFRAVGPQPRGASSQGPMECLMGLGFQAQSSASDDPSCWEVDLNLPVSLGFLLLFTLLSFDCSHTSSLQRYRITVRPTCSTELSRCTSL